MGSQEGAPYFYRFLKRYMGIIIDPKWLVGGVPALKRHWEEKGFALRTEKKEGAQGWSDMCPFAAVVSRQRPKSRLGQLVRAAKQGKTWLAGQARPPEELMAGKKAETSTSGSENSAAPSGYAVPNLTRLKLDAAGIVMTADSQRLQRGGLPLSPNGRRLLLQEMLEAEPKNVRDAVLRAVELALALPEGTIFQPYSRQAKAFWRWINHVHAQSSSSGPLLLLNMDETSIA